MEVNAEKKLHILIVDDSVEDRELYKRLLRQDAELQYRFREAETGEEGLEDYSREKPDCILLDYNLPDLDGLEFLAELKGDPLKDVAVVMLTGQGNESIAVQAMKSGTQDYLVKGDITGEGLNIAVKNAIEKVALRREIEIKNRKLSESYRELEQFAYVVSHDLQEPLRKIQAFGDRLMGMLDGKLDEQEADYLGRMVNAGERMQNLISALLTLSRASNQPYAFVPVDVAQLVKEVLSDLEIALEEAAVTVKTSGLSEIRADATQMRQLFQNLLGNAIKFRDKSRGGGRAEVAMETRGNAYLFFVRDDGIGMEPQHAERIFATFQRLHNREKYPGTGLGLSICKKIVERHGGRIWVQTAPGEGSTFYFTIPKHQGKEPA